MHQFQHRMSFSHHMLFGNLLLNSRLVSRFAGSQLTRPFQYQWYLLFQRHAREVMRTGYVHVKTTLQAIKCHALDSLEVAATAI